MRLTLRLFALACLFSFSLAALGQSFRGQITGTVTDSTGAIIPNATITVTNPATGQSRSLQSNSAGDFTAPELPIGSYTVSVQTPGFQAYKAENIQVDVSSRIALNIQLAAGQAAETVVVQGTTALARIETASDVLGATLTQQEISELPINGRDYTKLIYLAPGVAGSPDQISDSPGSYGPFSMNGARGRSNNFLLDGTDENDGYRNDPALNEPGVFGTPATILPIDALAEVRVLSNFEPEYGRNAGGVINIVTRSGTNSFHGNAFDYFRNNALDARNYFNFRPLTQAPLHNNQFGASLGGPVVRDKTFFFFDYEGQQERVGTVSLACVPTADQLAAATNPVIQSLIARNPWPAANSGGICRNADGSVTQGEPSTNASVVAPSYNNITSLIAKIDENIRPGQLVTGRYYYGDSKQSFPLALAGGGVLPGFNTYTPTRVQLVSLSYVNTFAPTVVNEARFGWNRFAEGFFPQDASFNPSSIGLGNNTGIADEGLPVIQVTGFAQLGANHSDPRHRFDTNWQAVDDLSWTRGRHSYKFGYEFRRTSINLYNDFSFRGNIKFATLDDFLAGDVTGGTQASGNTQRRSAQNNHGLYAQDTFRINPRLTLTYGLRWDYYGIFHEKNDLLSNITSLDATDATFTLTQVGQPGLSQLYDPKYDNIAPRVSLAYDPTGQGRTVIRAGWGIFYDAFSQDVFLGHVPYNSSFDPGPAYNPIGPAPIYLESAIGGPITPNAPIFFPGIGTPFGDTFSVTRKIDTPNMQNYNLNLQQQLSPKATLQLGYVGSIGRHLLRFRDINQPNQAEITASDLTNGISSYGVPRVYGNNPYGSFYVNQEEATATSNYNSFQAQIRIDAWHNITSIFNYVWSHSLDNASDSEDFIPNASQPNDSTRPQLEYSNSNFDIRNRLTWVFGYEMPTTSESRLRKGWGLDSTVGYQTGQPFQFNYNFEDDFSGSGEGFDRPDVVAPIHKSNNPFQFMNLNAFAIPCTTFAGAANGVATDCIPGTRHFGNLPRTSLTGPTYANWDLALYKNTAITERVRMQLRAEFYNLPNHPNFASPFLPNYIADPAYNGFASAGNREVGTGYYPLQATGDVGIGNPFLGGGGPRGIQLAAKFTF